MSDYDPLIKIQAAMFAVRNGLTTPVGDGVVFSYPVRGSRDLSSDLEEARRQAEEVGLAPATEEQIERYLSWKESAEDSYLFRAHFKVSRKIRVYDGPASWANQITLYDGHCLPLETVEIPCETYFDEHAPSRFGRFGCERVRSDHAQITMAIEELGEKYRRYRLARIEWEEHEISGDDYLKLKSEAEASGYERDDVKAYLDGLNRLFDPAFNTDAEHALLMEKSPSYRAGYEKRPFGLLSSADRVARFDKNLVKAGGRKLHGIRLRPLASAKLSRLEAETAQSVTAIINHLLESTDVLPAADKMISEW